MPGLINELPNEPTTPILKQAEDRIEGTIQPSNAPNYRKIVIAGMKIAMNGGPRSIIYGLRNSKNPVRDCAIGAVGLVALMRKQSHGTMPIQAMVPAAMTLMIKALDFANNAGIAKVGQQELVQATHLFTTLMFKMYRITPQMLQNAVSNVHDMLDNPVQRAAIERTAAARGV